MDGKLRENVDLVEKFMLERIIETLQETQYLGDNILNVLLMNMLLLLQRNAGDTTIKDILDGKKEEELI
jgi:hypothetical protein